MSPAEPAPQSSNVGSNETLTPLTSRDDALLNGIRVSARQPSPRGRGSQAFFTLAVQRITTIANNPQVRVIALTLLYLAIILGLVILYGRGNFSTPPFIYQGY